MNAMNLMATLGIDTSAYESGLKGAAGSAQNFASKLGTILKGVAAGKLLLDIGKGAVNAYKDYEQLVGGVDTLFKGSSSRIQAYAEQAYKTAGMSANEYMSTAVSFSASLLNSLAGDTEKAAEQTNKAITDMADNANKMGTSLEMVQNAYRGFARGNYTMLDNLSLGFSGTKEGMQELLDKAQKLSGVKYDISSLSDIIDAIHEVQVAMDITGTTAKEAMDTIEGSGKAVQAAWQNVLSAIAGGGGLSEAINGLMDSLFGNGSGGFVNNLMTRVGEVVKGIAAFVGKAAPLFVKEMPKLLVGIGKSLVTSLPSMFVDLAKAIPSALLGLFEGIDDVILPLVTKTVDRASESFQSIKSLIEAGIKGTVALEPDNGQSVLDKAKEITGKLNTEYKGMITIDGDPKAAQQVISDIESGLQSLTENGSASVNDLLASAEKLEKIKISPTLGEEEKKAVEEQITSLKASLDGLKELPITVTADGKQALIDARAVASSIQNDKDCVGTITIAGDDGKQALDSAKNVVDEINAEKGTIVIDGDAKSADEALATVQNAIDKLISGKGNVEDLQKAINAVNQLKISPEINGTKLVAVQNVLANLKADLEKVSEGATVTYSYKEAADSNYAGFSKFAEFVEKNQWDTKDFTATASFKVDGSTPEEIEEFAGAITAAATAVRDYNEASKKITSLAEQKLNADMANVNQQAEADLAELGRLYNKGLMTEEEYSERGRAILQKTEDHIQNLVDNYQQTVERAERFSDGLKSNDYDTALKWNAELREGEDLSADTYTGAFANLAEMGEAGRKATDNDKISAKIALEYLTGRARETKDAVDKASEDYKTSMAKIVKLEEEAGESQQFATVAESLTGLVDFMSGAADDRYDPTTKSMEEMQGSIKQAIDAYEEFMLGDYSRTALDEQTDALVSLISSIMYDEEGNAKEVDSDELIAAAADVLADLQAKAKEDQEKADAAKQEAQAALQEALQAAADKNEFSAEELSGLIDLIRQAGVDVSEETESLITNVEQAAETAANQAASDSESAVQKSLDTIKNLNEAVASFDEELSKAEGKTKTEMSKATADGVTDGAQTGGAAGRGIVESEMSGITVDVKINPIIPNMSSLFTPAHYIPHASAMSGGEILRGMTPFGVDSNGSIHYGGEVGPEAVVGVNSLNGMIHDAVADALVGVLSRMDGLLAGQGMGDVKVVLDTGATVGGLVREMDKQMGGFTRWRGGGRA